MQPDVILPLTVTTTVICCWYGPDTGIATDPGMNPAPFGLNVPPGIHDGDAIVPDTTSNWSASDGAWVGEPVGEPVGALVGVPALASGIGPCVG
jgi:hypothetical protein